MTSVLDTPINRLKAKSRNLTSPQMLAEATAWNRRYPNLCWVSSRRVTRSTFSLMGAFSTESRSK